MTEVATIGHNNPPSDIEILNEKLSDDYSLLLDRADNLIEGSEDITDEINDDIVAGQVADYIKLINDCNKELEKSRKDVKEPYLEKGRAVDTFFKAKVNMLDNAKKLANKPLTAFSLKKREIERLEKEKAVQVARDEAKALLEKEEALRESGMHVQAEEAAQQAINEDKKAIKNEREANSSSGLGVSKGVKSSVSLRTKWVGTINDRSKLDISKLAKYFTDAELKKALNGFVSDGGREIDGAEIKEESTVVTR